MRWTECELLHLCKVVAGVPVEGELAHRMQGELGVGPDLKKGSFVMKLYCKVLNKSSGTCSELYVQLRNLS